MASCYKNIYVIIQIRAYLLSAAMKSVGKICVSIYSIKKHLNFVSKLAFVIFQRTYIVSWDNGASGASFFLFCLSPSCFFAFARVFFSHSRIRCLGSRFEGNISRRSKVYASLSCLEAGRRLRTSNQRRDLFHLPLSRPPLHFPLFTSRPSLCLALFSSAIRRLRTDGARIFSTRYYFSLCAYSCVQLIRMCISWRRVYTLG